MERNRFSAMKDTIRRLRAPANSAAMFVKKSMDSFCLQYTYPKCPEPKYIRGKKCTEFIALFKSFSSWSSLGSLTVQRENILYFHTWTWTFTTGKYLTHVNIDLTVKMSAWQEEVRLKGDTLRTS